MSNKSKDTKAHDPKDLWSLPTEEAIAWLIQEHDMTRERAEAILHRDRNYVRRHAMVPLTEEEFEEQLEEIARSGGLTLSRKDLDEQSDGEEPQAT